MGLFQNWLCLATTVAHWPVYLVFSAVPKDVGNNPRAGGIKVLLEVCLSLRIPGSAFLKPWLKSCRRFEAKQIGTAKRCPSWDLAQFQRWFYFFFLLRSDSVSSPGQDIQAHCIHTLESHAYNCHMKEFAKLHFHTVLAPSISWQ